MTVRFGVTVVQFGPYPDVRDDFLFAESIGLDNAWVIDQFGIDEVPEIPLLEAWTSLAALAADTSRIHIGSMVTNVAMRNVGVLATSMLTVDQISAGRLVTALGGGFYPAEHAALGVPFLDGRRRTDRLRETIEALDVALRGETVTYHGDHVRLTGATFRPLPTRTPRPPIWVAAQGERAQRVAARFAQGTVSLGVENGPIEESLPAFRARMERLDDICVQEGRDPASLRRCYFAGWADEAIFASPDATSDFVGRYVNAGATDFTFYLHNPSQTLLDDFLASHRMATRDQLEVAALEVFPAFRD